MKSIATTLFVLICVLLIGMTAWGQTNPTAQSLPYTETFGLAWTSTTYPIGFQGWTISTSPGSTFNTAAPTTDRTLVASSSASTTSGNVHNYNGKIGFLNSTSLDLSVAFAINTTGLINISVSYDIMTVRNPYDGTSNTRINEVTLQYRVGTSGTFTNLTGIEYQNNTTTQTGAVTTPQNLQTKNITLPTACENQSVVQLRLASRQVSGAGSRPSFAIDNISVTGSAPPTQYRSLATGNWNSTSTWQMSTNGGLSWVSATSTPTSTGGAVTIQSGHTVTVSASVTADELTISSGGTLSVASGQVLTINDGTGTDLTVTGTLTLDGQLTNNGSVSLNGTLQLNSGAALSGTALTYGSSSTLVYNNTGSITVGSEWGLGTSVGLGIPKNVTIQNSTALTLVNGGGARTVPGNLSISSGSLTLGGTSGDDLNVGGNWTTGSGASFSAASRAVIFNGASSQSITGGVTFGDFNISSGNGVIVNDSIAVNGTLTLGTKLIQTSGSAFVTASTISRTSGYVYGNLKKYISTGSPTFSYEIGDATNYTPVNLAFTNVTTAGYVTARTTAGAHPQIASSGLNTSKMVNRYWSFTNDASATAAFTSYDAIFNFQSGDVIGGANTSNFIGKHYSSSTWSSPTVGIKTTTSTQLTGNTTFSDYAIGELLTYSLTVQAGTGGTLVAPGASPWSGTVLPAALTTITASANTGYNFVNWTNPVGTASITNASAISTTVALNSGDATVQANFAIITYSLTVSAGTGGSITAPASSPVTVNYGVATTITASASTGYNFVNWTNPVGTASIGNTSTISTTATLTSGDAEVHANFAIKTYSLTVSAGTGGSISAPATSPVTVDYGVATTITAVASPGYTFTGWTKPVGTSSIANASLASTTVTLTAGDAEVHANFAGAAHTITASVNGSGTINPTGATTVADAADQTFTFSASTGYHLDSLLVDNVKIDTATTSYTFFNVLTNHTIEAFFSINTYTLTVQSTTGGAITAPSPTTKLVNYNVATTITASANTGYNFVDWTIVSGSANIASPTSLSTTATLTTSSATVQANFAIQTFTITPSTTAGGSITPATAQIVNYGTNKTFTFGPNTGYHFDSLLVDNMHVDSATTSYTFFNVQAAHTIDAFFSIYKYELSVSSGTGGSITAPATSPVIVDYGVATTITALPSTGYTFTNWTNPVGTALVANANSVSTTVTLTSGNAEVHANFAIITYQLTVSATTGGTITEPLTSPVTVNYGNATTITTEAAAHYHFINWTVTSGSASIANASILSTTVTLTSGNATVRANFAIDTYQLTVSAGNGGSITAPVSSLVTVDYGVAAIITASPSTGYSFTNWSNPIGTATIANTNAASTTATLTSGNAEVHANFAVITYQLTVNSTIGGSITAPVTSTVTVDYGVATTITAVANPGYVFTGWTKPIGTSTIANASSASTTVTLTTGDATVQANFVVEVVTSIGSGNWSSGTTWDQGAKPAASQVAVIASGHTVTLTATDSCEAATVKGTGVLDLAGFTLQLHGTFSLEAGAEAKMSAFNAIPGNGTTPYAFDPASYYTFYGTTTGFSLRNPSVQTVTFGNLNWNSSGNATPAVGTMIAGNLEKRGSGEMRCGTGSSSRTIVVHGNAYIKVGILVANNAATPATGMLDVDGDLIVDSLGSIRGVNSSGDGTIKVGGNFINNSSGQIVNMKPATSGATGNFTIYFKGSNTSTFTPGANDSCRTFIVQAGKTVMVTTNGFNVQRAVQDSGSLYLGTNIVKGAGTFTVANGATLGIGSPDGIDGYVGMIGNVQVAGARTFGSGGFYIFNASTPQMTGNGLPATITGGLTFDNTTGVAYTTALLIQGTLNLTNGVVTPWYSSPLVVDVGGTINRTNGYVNGPLKFNMGTGSNITRTFDIGDVTNYTPVVVNFNSITTGGSLSAQTTAGPHGSISSSELNASKIVNRYYTLTNNSMEFVNYNATFNFVSGDILGSADPSKFVVKKFDTGTWSTPTIGTKTGTSTQITGVGSFSDFAIGELLTYSLNLTAVNGTVAKNPDQITYDIGTSVELTPHPATGYHFVDWSGDLTGSANPATVVMNADKNITANFAINTYQLTVSAGSGGTITAPASSPVTVDHGVATIITAFANAHYHLVNWTVTAGSAAIANANAISTTATLTAGNATVRANFAVNTYQLTVTPGTGGTITTPSSSPVAVTDGVVQAITASANPCYNFVNWTVTAGIANIDDANALSTTVTLSSGNATIQANFAKIQYTLHVTGNNGAVAVIIDPAKDSYDCGESVTLTILNRTGWLFTGWSGDLNGTSSPVTITMDGNKNIYYNIIDDPAYQAMYRSFSSDAVALDRDNKGIFNKYVLRKPVRSDFIAKIGADSMNVNKLHVEFGSGIEQTFPFFTVPPSIITLTTGETKFKKYEFAFATALNIGDSIEIHGFGDKGKVQNISKYYFGRDALMFTKKGRKDPLFTKNLLCLSMPNRVNVLYETFYNTRYGTDGMVVGKIRNDDVKNFGWYQTTQYGDVLKTLFDSRTQVTHSGAARGFDVFDGGTKAILKKQTSLPPSKFNNKLLADMIALKLNIVASDYHYTPAGYGDLIYTDNTSDYDGMTIRDIADLGDGLMMGWLVDSTYLKSGRPVTVKNHKFASASLFTALGEVVAKINNAFEGAIDTLHFVDSLRFAGYKKLADVPFLAANPHTVPFKNIFTQNIYTSQEPTEFALYQNYPNPFNPSTTIKFDLSTEALVTLKIYNMLGQEVTTLLNREDMSEGSQEVQFNAQSLTSGVYLYRIVAERLDEDGNANGTFQTVKKMMLLK